MVTVTWSFQSKIDEPTWFDAIIIAMSSNATIFNAICFILVQLLFINDAIGESVTRYHNASDYISKWRSDRLKRSLHDKMPDRLKILMKYGAKLIRLDLIKTSQYLANEHLPIITTSVSLNSNVMDDVGEFLTYHDTEMCASVVYFDKTHTLTGHVGMDYGIEDVPFYLDADGNYPGVVEVQYIPKHIFIQLQPSEMNPSEDAAPSFNYALDLVCPTVLQRLIDDLSPVDDEIYEEMTNANISTTGKIRKRRWDPLQKLYYLEILVFITHDVAEIAISNPTDNHAAWIVKYCIRYFNAVDTIFEKIRPNYVRLMINIAKIVILDDLELPDFTTNNEIQFTETVLKLRKYLSEHKNNYTPDSFDHVFMITSRQIMQNSIRVSGMTDYSENLYEKRDNGQFYDAIPITLVDSASSYVNAVSQISTTLNIKTTSLSIDDSRHQCSMIQDVNTMCINCLNWNQNEQAKIGEFFSKNHNRCFLLNQPRSLRPPGPSRLVTPIMQCRCFGHNPLKSNRRCIKVHECNLALQCQGVNTVEYILPPFDGTPCRALHVCWNGSCVSTKVKD